MYTCEKSQTPHKLSYLGFFKFYHSNCKCYLYKLVLKKTLNPYSISYNPNWKCTFTMLTLSQAIGR